VLVSPAGHVVHPRSAVAAPAVDTYVPATQVVHAAQVGWFTLEVYVPAAQAEQFWSVVAPPAVDTYVPAAHVVHAAQLAEFAAVLYVPLAQLEQTRSVVALPVADSYCPALHVVWEPHAVAGSESLSQVPATHGIAAATPPAQ
jgi:hypothetical protein